MTNESQVHVSFAVYGFDVEIDAMTAAIGIAPTRAWCKGEPISGHGTAIRLQSQWTLDSRLDVSASIEQHLTALVSRLESVKAGIERIAKTNECGIGVAAYFSETNPGFLIKTELLKRIAALDLDLDFDLYNLAATEE